MFTPNKELHKLLMKEDRFLVIRKNDRVYIFTGSYAANFDQYYYNNIFRMQSASYPEMIEEGKFRLDLHPNKIFKKEQESGGESLVNLFNQTGGTEVIATNIMVEHKNLKGKPCFFRVFKSERFISYVDEKYFKIVDHELCAHQGEFINPIVFGENDSVKQYIVMPVKPVDSDISALKAITSII